MKNVIKLCILLLLSVVSVLKSEAQIAGVGIHASGTTLFPLSKGEAITPSFAYGGNLGVGLIADSGFNEDMFHYLSLNYSYALSNKKRVAETVRDSKYHLAYLSYELFWHTIPIKEDLFPVRFGINLGWGQIMGRSHESLPLIHKVNAFYWAPKVGVDLGIFNLTLRYDNIGQYRGLGAEIGARFVISKS